MSADAGATAADPRTRDVDDADRRAWIALASVDGIGLDMFWRLLGAFGRPSDVVVAAASGEVSRWERTQRKVPSLPVIRPTTMAELAALPASIDECLADLAAAGLWTLTERDRDYPARLRDLDPPPPLIHGLGDAQLLSTSRAVAVVGTRRPTPAGRLLAGQVAGRLVEAACVVVSGVAVGIDGAAHAATLAQRGQTIGVIGGGHHHPGPSAHTALRRQIVESNGALISEHHPSVKPTKGTYPRRNRIIAALSDATIVIEAPKISGALITARIALELGRTVLVAPGRIGDWSTAGCLRLLRETPARPLVGLDEMIVDLDLDRDPAEVGGTAQNAAQLTSAAALQMLKGAELSIARRLRRAPAGLDVLVDDTGLAPSVVSSAVTLLLMRGWIQAIGAAYLPCGPLLVG